jgi:hypothetical protein
LTRDCGFQATSRAALAEYLPTMRVRGPTSSPAFRTILSRWVHTPSSARAMTFASRNVARSNSGRALRTS